jgi:small-conductance mechanosensitive channel
MTKEEMKAIAEIVSATMDARDAAKKAARKTRTTEKKPQVMYEVTFVNNPSREHEKVTEKSVKASLNNMYATRPDLLAAALKELETTGAHDGKVNGSYKAFRRITPAAAQ